MKQIYLVETRNGRAFRVFVKNKNQKERLFKMVKNQKEDKYEKVILVKDVLNGIHELKEFEAILNSLQ
ncbi:hypothetical protein [Aquamicrobium sp.]|uniref:hypothetical protein n=1 Tax=Aquamicrobium sp. TaxID=1872579 RepID=UPI00258869E8|nr:hypothetical protein [Aquamicrobium sp.]MCK9552333.1 hypothetical protein [Aquamicrobium sp.]